MFLKKEVTSLEKKEKLIDYILQCDASYVLSPFFNKNCVWNVRDISNAIETHDNNLCEWIDVVYQYGAYEMLAVLSEFVDTFCALETIEWFNKTIGKYHRSPIIIQMKEAFHTDRIESLEEYARLGIPSKSIEMTFAYTNVDIYKLLWKSIDAQFLSSLRRTDLSNIGIWRLGIYTEISNPDYISKLCSHVFANIIQTGSDIREYDNDPSLQKILIYNILYSYLVELEILQYQRLAYLPREMQHYDANVFAGIERHAFDKTLQRFFIEELRIGPLTIPEGYPEELRDMLRLIDYFGDTSDRTTVSLIKYHLPLFYQMLDRNEEAYTLLLEIVRDNSMTYKVHQSLLAAFYRSLLITKEEDKRNTLIKLFDEIYDDRNYIQRFRLLASDIITFYRKCNGNRRCLGDEIYDADDYVTVKWFRENQIAGKMQSLYDEMLNGRADQQSEAIDTFLDLFYNLTSHYDSYIRIDSEKCARVLGDTYDFDAEDAYEITEVYSDSEQVQLKEFRNRLKKIVDSMPDYKYCVLYKDLQNKALKCWKADDESVLCDKLQLAFKGIQSDRNNVNLNENGINNQVAYFLRGYYGENNIHREEPQGSSGTSKNSSESKDAGQTDVLVYKNGKQIAILEALRLHKLDRNKLKNHIDRLIINYDTQGVPYAILAVYLYTNGTNELIEKIEEYLKGYEWPYEVDEDLKDINKSSINIKHSTISFRRNGAIQRLHVYIVVMPADRIISE